MKGIFRLAFALLALTPAAARAWDAGGHLLIDTLAQGKLRPEVAGKAEALLPLLDARFHKGRPYDFVSAGTWMDDMRGLGKDYKWSRWHYIDVPCNGDRSSAEPPPPHALWALDQATEVLRNKAAEPKARAEALAQVMHLVGDIHQPLHVADRGDRGGNDVHLAPLGASNGKGPTNLHAFWDAAYRYAVVEGEITEGVPPLQCPQSREERDALKKHAMNVLASIRITHEQWPPWRQWAYETHQIACASGWPKEWLDGDKTAPVQLTPRFVETAQSIARGQITRAGERLAALLNALLGDESATPLKIDRSPTPPAPSVR